MIRRTGNMLAHFTPNRVYLVTTNSYIRRDGALVMGRGAAKQLARMLPRIPYEFGKRIEHLGEYNVGTLRVDDHFVGAFQVKYNFADAADPELISRSVDVLAEIAEGDDRTFHLNYPGIGNGRLGCSVVEPIIARLPDNVHVWTFS